MKKREKVKEKIKKIKKKISKRKMTKREILFNAATFLNILRILLTFVIVYMIVVNKNIIHIVIVFIIAAFTDLFDGIIARKYNLVNGFGAKADMFADRFLGVITILAVIFVYGTKGLLTNMHGILILLLMMREIISMPFAVVSFISGRTFPPARKIAKFTTAIQGVGVPALMLSIFYSAWLYLAIPVAIITAVTGIISGIIYAKESRKVIKK